jgi:hypothetical protein
MVDYIKQLIADILRDSDPQSGPSRRPVYAVCDELQKLDPRDFEPAAQAKFVQLRSHLRSAADQSSMHPTKVRSELLKQLLPILDMYKGEGSRGTQRSFPYVSDPDLQKIIERDYYELTVKLFPSGAWKSTAIMAGSILEAMLFDILSNPIRIALVNGSPKAPKSKGGTPIDIATGDWKLISLIEVAVEIGILTFERMKTIDQVLRDYRNFVHPKKEIRSMHPCGKAEAGLAMHGLDGVCDHLERTL